MYLQGQFALAETASPIAGAILFLLGLIARACSAQSLTENEPGRGLDHRGLALVEVLAKAVTTAAASATGASVCNPTTPGSTELPERRSALYHGPLGSTSAQSDFPTRTRRNASARSRGVYRIAAIVL
jgi:hypothetical protein